jgi:uncharacterized protein (TIGR02145 family)
MPPTVAISVQAWTQTSNASGTRISTGSAQTNNSTVDKWCYSDLDAKRTTYGAIYTWDEAMQHKTTEASQGVCPDDLHIPTVTEYNTLISNVGGSANADTQLKSGGASGFNGLLGGSIIGGTSMAEGPSVNFWTSTQSDVSNAWKLNLWTSADANTYAMGKNVGAYVRCIRN